MQSEESVTNLNYVSAFLEKIHLHNLHLALAA